MLVTQYSTYMKIKTSFEMLTLFIFEPCSGDQTILNGPKTEPIQIVYVL